MSGTDDLVGELATADAAVAAAGTVSWELCCLGVPSVLVAVAPNQEPVAANLARAGAAIQAPPAAEQVVAALLRLTADAPLRAHMGAIGRSLVDGLGARRVVCRLRAALLSLRGAKEGDARRLHEWRNEPAMRAASFSPEPVPWDAHIMWLRDRLARSTSAIYIASDSWGDVGVVRFDEDGSGVAEVSVTVAKERRGEGWGGALVDAGCRRLATERGTTRIDARIKAGNEASIRAFIDADFDRVPGDDPEVLRYARQTDGQERRARTEPRSAPR